MRASSTYLVERWGDGAGQHLVNSAAGHHVAGEDETELVAHTFSVGALVGGRGGIEANQARRRRQARMVR